MKFIESFKYLSQDPIAQLFQYYIYRSDVKNAVKHPLASGSIERICKYQAKINGLYEHICSNLTQYSQRPEPFVKYLHDSIKLKYSDEDLLENFNIEFKGLGLTMEKLNFLFSGEEYDYCLEEFKRLQTVQNAVPFYIQNSTYIQSEDFIRKAIESCKRFGLAGLIVPRILQSEEFFITLEKNISYLSNKCLIQSQAFGDMKIILSINDNDYSGLPEDLYKNIIVEKLDDGQILFKINTDAFKYENFIDLPHDKFELITEHVQKKPQYRM